MADRKSGLRIALLDCEDNPIWPKDHYLKFYCSGLQRDGDVWDVFYVARDNKVPSFETLKKYQAIVISGSRHDARTDDTHNHYPWMTGLESLIREILNEGEEEGLRMYGACFGNQMVARAMGGEVGRNKNDKFIFGLEKVELKREGEEPTVWNCYESHGDSVHSLPEGATLLASSKSTRNEIWKLKNCICIQPHPEFSQKFFEGDLTDLVEKRLKELQRQREFGAAEGGKDDNVKVNNYIREFLVGE
mmetsp:Transcript_6326/g.9599  ORF Transcript_6326/g.9599 Transcript_6326/m.9599 type:complete len:247 (+) Transcript_6326:53-793(+)